MVVWKNSPLDAILVLLSLGEFGAVIALTSLWGGLGLAGRVVSYFLLTLLLVYNVIILSHLFTHRPWFSSPVLNRIMSMVNSATIGQSVQCTN